MHLRQQSAILSILAEQIRVWNCPTYLPHTLSLTLGVFVVTSTYIARAEVGIEIRGRTIVSHGYKRTTGIVRAQDRAASFKIR
jgi:hypothetical protein